MGQGILANKLMTAEEAVAMIKDGATINVTGAGLVGSPGVIFKTIQKSFKETGHPCGLTVMSAGSPGMRKEKYPEFDYFNYLTTPGILKRIIAGHFGTHNSLFPQIINNEIEAYNISQGVLSLMFNESIAGKKGYLTKVGLHTNQDPRYGGGKLNEKTTEYLVEVREENGEEYLFFKNIPVDVAVIKGSTADANGNITFEKEPADFDPLSMAMAAKNNGGKLIVYVSRVSKDVALPRTVRIPGFMVDAIVVDNSTVQFDPEMEYSPYYSGEKRCGTKELNDLFAANEGKGMHKRDFSHSVIARRAAMELTPGAVVNIGIGIPQMVGAEGEKIGINSNDLILTTETGIVGGVQIPSIFGVSVNVDAIYDQASQFRFYEGGGLDLGFLGALEIDKLGNCNASRKGAYFSGIGGFGFITYSAKKLIFCFTFERGSGLEFDGDTITVKSGKGPKLVDTVEQIDMNAGVEIKKGKEILYVTERCVFRATSEGLELIEIAPGLDVQKDILDALDFTPKISPELKNMPKICFDRTI